VIAVSAAFVIIRRRDVGAGIVRPRPGPAVASGLLGRPVGLAFRLQRGSLIVWGIVLAVAGAAVAGVVTQADVLAEMEAIRRAFLLGGGDIVDSIFGTYLMFMALLAMAYALLGAGQLRSEETAGRAEPVLATATSRLRWAGSHVAVMVAGTIFVLGLGGLVAGAIHAANVGDASQLPRLFGLALTWVPATLVFIGLSVALFGLWPRAMVLAWVVYAYGALATMFGPLLELPDWVDDLSPIGQTPRVPGVELDLVPLIALIAVAGLLLAVGLLGFGRRDVQSPA
jgi:ABC-2 type transport system permease protein